MSGNLRLRFSHHAFCICLAGLSVGSMVAAEPSAQRNEVQPSKSNGSLPAGVIRQISGGHFVGTGQLTYVSLGPNDRSLAVCDCIGVGRLWDVQTGKMLAQFTCQRYSDLRKSVVWSRDGTRLAVAEPRDAVVIINASSGQIEHQFDKKLVDDAKCVRFSPDGKTLAVGRMNGIVAIDVASGTPIRTMELGDGNTPGLVAFQDDGKLLDAIVPERPRPKLFRFNWPSGNRVEEPAEGWREHLGAPEPGGDGVGTIPQSGWIQTNVGQQFVQIDTKGKPIIATAVSRDEKVIAAGHRDGKVTVWKISDKSLLADFEALVCDVNFLSLSPDGSLVAAGSSSSVIGQRDAGFRVHVYKIADGAAKELHPDKSATGWIKSIDFGPTNFEIVISCANKAEIRDLTTGQVLSSLERGYEISIAPAAKLIALHGLNDGSRKVRVYNIAKPSDPKPVAELTGTNQLALSPDGRWLATLQSVFPPAIRIYNVTTKETTRDIKPAFKQSFVLLWSPDGKYLACGGLDESSLKTLVWNGPTGESLGEFDGKILRFTFDSRKIISMARHGNATELLVSNISQPEKPLQTLALGSRPPVSYALFPDNGRLLTGNADGSLQVWDIVIGKSGKSIAAHGAAVGSVAISPDGKQVVSGGGDGVIYLWDAKEFATP